MAVGDDEPVDEGATAEIIKDYQEAGTEVLQAEVREYTRLEPEVQLAEQAALVPDVQLQGDGVEVPQVGREVPESVAEALPVESQEEVTEVQAEVREFIRLVPEVAGVPFVDIQEEVVEGPQVQISPIYALALLLFALVVLVKLAERAALAPDVQFPGEMPQVVHEARVSEEVAGVPLVDFQEEATEVQAEVREFIRLVPEVQLAERAALAPDVQFPEDGVEVPQVVREALVPKKGVLDVGVAAGAAPASAEKAIECIRRVQDVEAQENGVEEGMPSTELQGVAEEVQVLERDAVVLVPDAGLQENGIEVPQVGPEVHEVQVSERGVPDLGGGGVEDVEVEDVDVAVKMQDPLFGAMILRTIDGTTFGGVVADIHWYPPTGVFLYFIRYEDGDVEHLEGEEVARFLQLRRQDRRHRRR